MLLRRQTGRRPKCSEKKEWWEQFQQRRQERIKGERENAEENIEQELSQKKKTFYSKNQSPPIGD